jgi:hypothetical protein
MSSSCLFDSRVNNNSFPLSLYSRQRKERKMCVMSMSRKLRKPFFSGDVFFPLNFHLSKRLRERHHHFISFILKIIERRQLFIFNSLNLFICTAFYFAISSCSHRARVSCVCILNSTNARQSIMISYHHQFPSSYYLAICFLLLPQFNSRRIFSYILCVLSHSLLAVSCVTYFFDIHFR